MFVQTWALPRTQRWFKRWPGLRQGPSPADLSYCTQRRVLRVRKGLSQSNGWRTCIRAESTAEATAFQIISNISHHFTTQFALKKEMKIFRCCQSFSDFGLWVLSPKNAMATWAPTLVTWTVQALEALRASRTSGFSKVIGSVSDFDLGLLCEFGDLRSRRGVPPSRGHKGSMESSIDWSCLSADPGLSQGRGGAWDHRRCGTCLS